MPFPQSVEHLICHDEPLAPYTWLKIGGPARYYAEPTTRQELIDLVSSAASDDIPVRVLGGGANLLVRESGFDGLVVSMASAALSEIHADGTALSAGGGASISHVVTSAVGHGLSGIGHLIGIPGTIGGAVQGNASAGGSDIGSYVESLELLDGKGNVETRQRDELQFSFRHSDLGEYIIMKVGFRLESGDPVTLTKRLQKLWIVRRSKRPQQATRLALPFIDPDGASAADLIDQVGLKGAREGSVSLDPAQPEFLVAEDGATSEQVLALLANVREKVSLQTGVDLQMSLKIW